MKKSIIVIIKGCCLRSRQNSDLLGCFCRCFVYIRKNENYFLCKHFASIYINICVYLDVFILCNHNYCIVYEPSRNFIWICIISQLFMLGIKFENVRQETEVEKLVLVVFLIKKNLVNLVWNLVKIICLKQSIIWFKELKNYVTADKLMHIPETGVYGNSSVYWLLETWLLSGFYITRLQNLRNS